MVVVVVSGASVAAVVVGIFDFSIGSAGTSKEESTKFKSATKITIPTTASISKSVDAMKFIMKSSLVK